MLAIGLLFSGVRSEKEKRALPRKLFRAFFPTVPEAAFIELFERLRTQPSLSLSFSQLPTEFLEEILNDEGVSRAKNRGVASKLTLAQPEDCKRAK